MLELKIAMFICRRPIEQVPFDNDELAVEIWQRLRLQVLDVLCRASEISSSSDRGQGAICDVLSAVLILDFCALYAYDQLQACKHVVAAALKKQPTFDGMMLLQILQLTELLTPPEWTQFSAQYLHQSN
jgi:hypothetical protein